MRIDDALWSARLLQSDPALLRDIHAAYINAGARLIATNTYQASFEGFSQSLNLDADAAAALMRVGVMVRCA